MCVEWSKGLPSSNVMYSIIQLFIVYMCVEWSKGFPSSNVMYSFSFLLCICV